VLLKNESEYSVENETISVDQNDIKKEKTSLKKDLKN